MLRSGGLSGFFARLGALRFLLSGIASLILCSLHNTSWAGWLAHLVVLNLDMLRKTPHLLHKSSCRVKVYGGDLCGISTGK